ncbi:MAG: helix-turn-helix domain-containing protein [Actinoplanes sp.]
MNDNEERGAWVSQRAVSWVIDEAPVPTSLFAVLIVIARRCDNSGCGSYQSVPTIAEKTGKSADQVKRDIRELKKLGLIVPGDESLVQHLPVWKRPAVYDVALQMSGPKPVKESKNKAGVTSQGGGMDAPPGMDATGWHSTRQGGGMDALGGGGMDAPQTKPLKNPRNKPSLSPREDDISPPSSAEPEPEREIEIASQKPEPEEPTPIHRLLLDAGCPTENLDEVEAELIARHEPRSPAWWRTVAKNKDLPDLVAEVLEALQPVLPQLTADHVANAHPFVPHRDGAPVCNECDLPEANGRHRVGNQGGGYVSPRVNLADNNVRRSTSTLRGAQALRVAEDLDREYGHGRYAKHQTFKNPPIEAYRGEL